MDSLVFDTIVGTVFVFAVFAFAVSGVVEGLTRLTGLRAEFLLRGISSLLDSDTTFKKGWLKRIVDEAETQQEKSAGQAVTKALATLDQLPADAPARTKIQAALEQANTVLIPKAANTAAPEQADVTAAMDAVNQVPPLLERRREEINALPPGVDRDNQELLLAASRKFFRPAQQALEAATGHRQAVTVASVMEQPIVDLTAALKVPTMAAADKLSWRTKWKLPSYLSASTFSRALVNTLVPDPEGGTTTIDQLKVAVDGIHNDSLRTVLAGHLDEAKQDVEKFRKVVETWYDEHMARVTGWYKRHTRWYTLGVALVLALGFNVNAVAMAQALYSDQALRESVVTAAFSAADCNAKNAKTTTTPAKCLQDVRAQIEDFRGSGLPIGWGVVAACQVENNQGNNRACSNLNKWGLTSSTGSGWPDYRQFILVLLGWLIIALSSLVGARFWFDALSKLGTLRSSGPKPTSSA